MHLSEIIRFESKFEKVHLTKYIALYFSKAEIFEMAYQVYYSNFGISFFITGQGI